MKLIQTKFDRVICESSGLSVYRPRKKGPEIVRHFELSDFIPVGSPQRVEVYYKRSLIFLTELALFNAIDEKLKGFKRAGIAPHAFYPLSGQFGKKTWSGGGVIQMYAVNEKSKLSSPEVKILPKKKLHYNLFSPESDMLAYNLSMPSDKKRNFFSINNLESLIPIGHPVKIDRETTQDKFFELEHHIYRDAHGRDSNVMLVFDLVKWDNSSGFIPNTYLGVRDGFIVQHYRIDERSIPRAKRKAEPAGQAV